MARDSEARTLAAAVELRQQVQADLTQMRVRAFTLPCGCTTLL